MLKMFGKLFILFNVLLEVPYVTRPQNPITKKV